MIKSAIQHVLSPAREDGSGARTPLRCGNRYVLPPFFKVERDGEVVGEGRKGTFGGIKNLLVFGTNSAKLTQLLGRKRVDEVDDVKVGILGVADRGLFVMFGPGHQISF